MFHSAPPSDRPGPTPGDSLGTVLPLGSRSPAHRRKTAWLLCETVGLFVGLALLAWQLGALLAQSKAYLIPYAFVLLAQGLLLQRIYVVAHESVHRKLAPDSLPTNDLGGRLVLLPMLVPLRVYRKIHAFHHGYNRRDLHTSALDVIVSPFPLTRLVRAVCYGIWFLGVFAGGLFLHSLVSVVLFLFLPIKTARRVSPAFDKWTPRDRAIAWAEFLACVAFHAMVAVVFGRSVWLYALGLPLLMFAWVWSLLIYVFHYDTTVGEATRYNVRVIRSHAFFRWLLCNFNEHVTHHMYPNLPWYELPARKVELPAPYAERNPTRTSLLRSILSQLRGPTVVHRDDERAASHLFVTFMD
jgi:fatty acid desaturase